MSDIGGVAPLLAGRPDLVAGIERLTGLVEDGRIDPEILSLCRRRVGTLLGCPAHAGPVPAREQMDETQRACVDFAEMFVMDHQAITDDDARRVTDQIGDPGLVTLTTALAVYDGFCRFEHVMTGG
jgi:hypothetical protein